MIRTLGRSTETTCPAWCAEHTIDELGESHAGRLDIDARVRLTIEREDLEGRIGVPVARLVVSARDEFGEPALSADELRALARAALAAAEALDPA